jgi:hypothetical protein
LALSLVIAPESMVTPITKKKRKEKKITDEVLPTTTSRVNDRLPKTKMKKGSRVKTQRKTQRKMLYHLCSVVQRRKLPGNANNTYNVYGNVNNGSSPKGWDFSFDLFPPENKIVLGILRNRLTLVAEGAEENDYDRKINFADYEEVTTPPQQAATINKSPPQKLFLGLPPPQDMATATYYIEQWGKTQLDQIEWNILKDEDEISWDMPKPDPEGSVPKLLFDLDTKLDKLFFEKMMPCVACHALTIDRYFQDPHADMHLTVKNDGIKFHDPEAEDSDSQVKHCGILLITSASETENGADNIWKSGKTSGRRCYAYFGQYCMINMFKAFWAAAPFCRSDEEHWYTDKRDIPWEMIVPCIKAFSKRHNELFTTNLLVLDESMSGWRPKTSKYGGIPNYTLEPCKPVPLGTMLRNGVDATNVILAYQDVVQFSKIQKQKDYHDENSHLPNGVEINDHCAETLRQAEGVNVVEGGWIGGDAWFGSVMMAVELKKRLNLNSTFIINDNIRLYPTKALHGILRSRFGDKAAGHWIVMTTTIAGVKLATIAYAWSQRGMSYFLSTCGSTSPSSIMYQSNFEDEFGNMDLKMLPRPQVCHFLYEYLPLIDEHNKHHQYVFHLEKKWRTKDCWFCLLVTLTGICVANMHHLYRQQKNCHNQLLGGAIM